MTRTRDSRKKADRADYYTEPFMDVIRGICGAHGGVFILEGGRRSEDFENSDIGRVRNTVGGMRYGCADYCSGDQ